jgi:hypothetical protein
VLGSASADWRHSPATGQLANNALASFIDAGAGVVSHSIVDSASSTVLEGTAGCLGLRHGVAGGVRVISHAKWRETERAVALGQGFAVPAPDPQLEREPARSSRADGAAALRTPYRSPVFFS